MNDELKDFEMKSDAPGGVGGEQGATTPRWPWAIAAAVVVLAVIAFIWFRPSQTEEPAAQEAGEPAVSQPLDSAEDAGDLVIGEVPTLAESDTWLQNVVGQLSSHPELAEWMLTPELIQGFVVVVDNIAEGVAPRKHLEMVAPEEGFEVKESDGKVFVDPTNYQRFNLLVDVIESLDTAGTAELYQAMRPLCQQAYQDLGYPGDNFDATLSRAVNRLLATPVMDQPVALEKKITAYRFEDPALEELSPAAKQFLRLGPENLKRLQIKVRALARAIGLEGVD